MMTLAAMVVMGLRYALKMETESKSRLWGTLIMGKAPVDPLKLMGDGSVIKKNSPEDDRGGSR